MRTSALRRSMRVSGAGIFSAQAATARAEFSGFELTSALPPTPAMPFWALILLVLLIAAIGYLMTRKS